jgi:DNA-directed RNA polymerase specialized sigma subunit
MRDNYSDYYMTTREIAKEFGISHQRVEQIIDRAIEKLRKIYPYSL